MPAPSRRSLMPPCPARTGLFRARCAGPALPRHPASSLRGAQAGLRPALLCRRQRPALAACRRRPRRVRGHDSGRRDHPGGRGQDADDVRLGPGGCRSRCSPRGRPGRAQGALLALSILPSRVSRPACIPAIRSALDQSDRWPTVHASAAAPRSMQCLQYSLAQSPTTCRPLSLHPETLLTYASEELGQLWV
jgi:hypothetical protein